MRSLNTDAERTEAAALVQDRQHWLTRRGMPVPAGTDVTALFRESQATAAGLFEDEILLACMILERDPDLGWGDGLCLFLGHVHTLPGRSDDMVRLVTLWASDYAARLELPLVRTEILAPLHSGLIDDFLKRITDMGWDVSGFGAGQTGERVARLELNAEHRPGLSVLVGCSLRDSRSAADKRSVV
ncbi:hypothetical protein OG596_08955 [Streptomyces sp. NBC_01102]|uniref:hypothetical protein n=1 Tax=Streptomyces sp. NBC_01102 TaxID=2903749 RepID=UPI0038680FB4|nr:hypothetical protein OG596_08955 [Streptomyces sp. NBC_01102]